MRLMKILSKLFIVGIACISLVSLKADDNKADKAKKNKELAELFFEELLADPEASSRFTISHWWGNVRF